MWTYLRFDEDGEPDEGNQLPEKGSAFLAFDICRWAVVLGYRETGGCMSMLEPNVGDDCTIVAFAPLSTITNPDHALIERYTPWKNDEQCYADKEPVKLWRQ